MDHPNPSWRVPFAMAGVGLSAFTSGTIASLSLISIPAVLTNTTNSALLTNWRETFNGGVRVCPSFAIVASLIHISNAYMNRNSTSKGTRYSIMAGVSTMAIVPFTFILMGATNEKLFGLQEAAMGSSTAVDDTAVELVKKWGQLNLTRSILPALGAAIGCLVLL